MTVRERRDSHMSPIPRCSDLLVTTQLSTPDVTTVSRQNLKSCDHKSPAPTQADHCGHAVPATAGPHGGYFGPRPYGDDRVSFGWSCLIHWRRMMTWWTSVQTGQEAELLLLLGGMLQWAGNRLKWVWFFWGFDLVVLNHVLASIPSESYFNVTDWKGSSFLLKKNTRLYFRNDTP